MKQKRNKKALWNGSLSILLSAAVLAVVIVFNLLIDQLPASLLRPDTSREGVLTLGESTKNVTDALTEDVTLYHIVQPDNTDPRVEELLARYASLSSHITVETVNPVTRPTFTAEYTSGETLSENSIIAVSGKRSTVVDGSALYKYRLPGDELNLYSQAEYQYYYEQYAIYMGQELSATPFFFGENEVTRAIDYVTTDTLPVLYALTGHGEAEAGDALQAAITAENVELRDLSLVSEAASGGVPQDAAAVFVNAPEQDITEDELKLLIAYVDRGGSVLMTTYYELCTAEDAPNLAALASHMGLTGISDVVLEGDESRYTTSNPYMLLPIVTSNGMNASLSSTNITLYMYACHPIVQTGEDDLINAVPLLTTSDKAFLMSELQAQIEGGNESPTLEDVSTSTLALGWQATREGGGTLYWFGAPQMFDESFVSANSPLLAAFLQTACEKPAAVSIVGKEVPSSVLDITQADLNLWLPILMVAVPLVPLAIGFTVWFRRKRA